jgi:hypothetical protein
MNRAVRCAARRAWLAGCCSAASALAQTPNAAGSGALPSMGFAATIAADELYDALRKSPTLAALDKEKVGSPVTVRVSLEFGRTGSASNMASAILTLSTLGLLPAVNNRDLIVTYDLVVNGSILTSYSYEKKITRVFNMYSTDRTHGLGDDGLAWLVSTAGQFAADLARDANYANLLLEYHYYYDAPPAKPAP